MNTTYVVIAMKDSTRKVLYYVGVWMSALNAAELHCGPV